VVGAAGGGAAGAVLETVGGGGAGGEPGGGEAEGQGADEGTDGGEAAHACVEGDLKAGLAVDLEVSSEEGGAPECDEYAGDAAEDGEQGAFGK